MTSATDQPAGGSSLARSEAPLVSVVEDDLALLSVLQRTLRHAGYRVAGFESEEEFLDSKAPAESACILLDMGLIQNGGHRLRQRLTERDVTATVLLMSGHADVNTVVSALGSGAAEFLVKPFRREAMLESVRVGVARGIATRRSRVERDRVRGLIDRLTPREIEVIELLVAGSDTKDIATQLAISPRTVEIHRQHLMRKMEVTSVVHLVRLCLDSKALDSKALDSEVLTGDSPPAPTDS